MSAGFQIARDPWGLPVFLRVNFLSYRWELWRDYGDTCRCDAWLNMECGLQTLERWLNYSGIPVSVEFIEHIVRSANGQRKQSEKLLQPAV